MQLNGVFRMYAICFTEVLTRRHCNPKKVVIQLVHAQTQILTKHVIASTTVMCCYSETVGQKIAHDIIYKVILYL